MDSRSHFKCSGRRLGASRTGSTPYVAAARGPAPDGSQGSALIRSPDDQTSQPGRLRALETLGSHSGAGRTLSDPHAKNLRPSNIHSRTRLRPCHVVLRHRSGVHLHHCRGASGRFERAPKRNPGTSRIFPSDCRECHAHSYGVPSASLPVNFLDKSLWASLGSVRIKSEFLLREGFHSEEILIGL